MNSTRVATLLATPLLCAALAAPAARAAEGVAAQGIQLFAAGRVADGEKILAPWVAAHPKDSEATYYLGRCHFSRHDYDGAVDWLEKAAELAPKNAEYQLWLGRAYGRAAQEANMLRAAGLASHARQAYEQAVALDPGQLDARGDLVQFYLLAPGFMGGSIDKARAQAAEIQKRDAGRGASA
ncbi:MAG TPA: tetratricopeptide repeat protein, partial [Thermoanaerobaculia bacterium]|nr:tetratricopeptide repeat protein [Thermoanaerobaculia bacterium]